MLLLAGGLVFWKSQSKDDAPEVVEEVKTAPKAEPKAPVLENAAPPPPSEEEMEEEEKEEEKAKTAKVGPAKPRGPAGCSGACKGSATAELRRALGVRGASARSCYNTALRRNPNLQGKMTVGVRISPNGTVCGASVSNNTMGDAAVASCVSSKFRAAKFPAPSGGCVDTAVPLNFTSQK